MGGKQALLIGVSQFGEGLAPLPSALRDVEALAEVLRDPMLGGFARDAVRVLGDPERTAMEQAVEDLFANRDRDDLLLLYFSGHGIRDEQRQLYLSCRLTALYQQGADKGRLKKATALPAASLRGYMQNSRSGRQVVILDCCFSGAIAEGMAAKDDGTIDLQEAIGGKGRAVLASSASTEVSMAGAQTSDELSVYTRFLVEGIRTGGADREQRGYVDAEDLHRYASRRVAEAAPAMTPKFYPTEEGFSIVVSRVRRDPSVPYRLELQKLAEARKGRISVAGREILRLKREQLGLAEPAAQLIEAEVLRPWQEYAEKLGRYDQLLQEMHAASPELTGEDLEELRQLSNLYKLRDSDLAAIHQRLGIPEQVMAAAPSPRTEGETRPDTTPAADLELPDPQPESPPSGGGKLITFPNSECAFIRKQGNGWSMEKQPIDCRGFREPLSPEVGLEMVAIAGGSFLMGSPAEELERGEAEGPQHEVHLAPFFLGRTPITQAQWRVVAGWQKAERDLKPDPSRFKGAHRPVEQVSWWDAMEFCRRLSLHSGKPYGLPSEAQWEYGCRAGTTTPFCFGDTITPELGNYDGNYTYGDGPKGEYRKQTSEVGAFPANPWGLHDMHGNVWEWCEDHWHSSYNEAPMDGSPWLEPDAAADLSRLLRGGSWFSNPRYCRSAYRLRNHHPDNRHNYIGFRVCCLPQDFLLTS